MVSYGHVLKTWRLDLSWENRLDHAAMGFFGELGELMDVEKKRLFKPGWADENHDAILSELGDLGFYAWALVFEATVAAACLHGVPEEVARKGAESSTKNVCKDMVSQAYHNAGTALPVCALTGDTLPSLRAPTVLAFCARELAVVTSAYEYLALAAATHMGAFVRAARADSFSVRRAFVVFGVLCKYYGIEPERIEAHNAEKLSGGHGWTMEARDGTTGTGGT